MLPVVLETTVTSDASKVEDPVRARVSKTVTVDGVDAVPEGSPVAGSVTAAERSGKVKGRARVAVAFHTLSVKGSDETYDIRTRAVARVAPGTKRQDAVTIVLPAAGGAIVGGIAGGKKGAAIGTAVGGGAGTAVVLTTRGREVRLERGARLSITLREPLTIKAPVRRPAE